MNPGPTPDASQPRPSLFCSPPTPSAESRMQRLADRALPRGRAQWIFFAVVGVVVAFAPNLPFRAAMAAGALATTAASAWCLVNFWRCREAHCIVSGVGWGLLIVVESVELAIGRTLTFGSDGLIFLAILVIALAFEVWWRWRHGTNAVRRPT